MKANILYYTTSLFVSVISILVFVLPQAKSYRLGSSDTSFDDTIVASGLLLYVVSTFLLMLIAKKEVRENLDLKVLNAGGLSLLILSMYVVLIPLYAIALIKSGL